MSKFKNEEGVELGLDDILQDSDYQAEFDKKVAKAIEKSKVDVDAEVKKKLDAALAEREEELRKNIQDEIDTKAREAEENAKLTEAEKYKKELDKVNQKLQDYENRIAVSDREKKIKDYIKEKGYDMDAIMEFVDARNMTDNFQDKIDDINTRLTEKINAAVNARLKDETDKVLGGKGKEQKPEFEFSFQPIKPTEK